jgi:hypothetical protein
MLLVSLVNTLALSYKFLVATTVIKSEEMCINAYDLHWLCYMLLVVRGWHVYGDRLIKACFFFFALS